MINHFVIFASFFFAFGAAGGGLMGESGDAGNSLAPITALTALIANPGRYHDKRALVGGYYLHDGSMHALCLQPRVASTMDCIYLNLKSPDDFRRLRGGAVYVEGLFQVAGEGQSGIYSGSITPERFKKSIEIRSR